MPAFTSDWVSHHTEKWLEHFGHLKDTPAVMLEIGCYEGRSAIWWCQNILTHPQARLICVDPFRDKAKYALFLQNIIEADLIHKIEVRRQPSEQAALPPNYLHGAYVDGWHEASAVMMDSMLVWRSLKSGGVMSFDDYLWPGKAVIPYMPPKPAIDSFLYLFRDKYDLLHQGQQVIVKKK